MRRVHRGAFASRLLAAELGGLAKQDRAFVTDLLYGALRHERYLWACLEPRLRSPEGLPEDVLGALQLAAYELLVRGTARAVVANEWVEVLKGRYGKLAGLANAVLRRLEPRDGLPSAVRYSVPDALYADWLRLLGEADAERAARGMLEPEPLWLLAYGPDAEARLAAEGCEPRPGPLPGTFAVRPPEPLPRLEAFRTGLVQAQNPSSVAVGRSLGAPPGARVYDLASGHGVKTAQLAAAGCLVLSLERDPHKLGAARRNLERLGLPLEGLAFDLRTAPPLPSAPYVLLDAPCSGTGTLRGHPEIKLRFNTEGVLELAALQAQLLDTAAVLTASGGRLLYAVCALTEAETTAQVTAFLARQRDFSLLEAPQLLPGPARPEGRFILPENGLDGFFVALLERSP